MYNTTAMTTFEKRHASAKASVADPQGGKAISILARNTDQTIAHPKPNRIRITTKRLSALDPTNANHRLNTT